MNENLDLLSLIFRRIINRLVRTLLAAFYPNRNRRSQSGFGPTHGCVRPSNSLRSNLCFFTMYLLQ